MNTDTMRMKLVGARKGMFYPWAKGQSFGEDQQVCVSGERVVICGNNGSDRNAFGGGVLIEKGETATSRAV
jgi:hypothetical protein